MADPSEQHAMLESLSRLVDDLASREQIRTCIYRVNRGMDRIDADLLTSGFFPEATIRWSMGLRVDFDTWLAGAIAMQHKTRRAQHLIGNILIDLRGDEANVESYEIGRHLTPMGDEMKDLIIAARYVDRFVRRDGNWRIIRREKVTDWMRIMEGSDPAYDRIANPGRRDDQDISYEAFGIDAFQGLI